MREESERGVILSKLHFYIGISEVALLKGSTAQLSDGGRIVNMLLVVDS